MKKFVILLFIFLGAMVTVQATTFDDYSKMSMKEFANVTKTPEAHKAFIDAVVEDYGRGQYATLLVRTIGDYDTIVKVAEMCNNLDSQPKKLRATREEACGQTIQEINSKLEKEAKKRGLYK